MDQDWYAMTESDFGPVMENDVRSNGWHFGINIGQQNVTSQQQYCVPNISFNFQAIPSGQAVIHDPHHLYSFNDDAATFDQANTSLPVDLEAPAPPEVTFGGWQMENIPYNAASFGTPAISDYNALQVAQHHDASGANLFAPVAAADFGAELPTFVAGPWPEVAWPLVTYGPQQNVNEDGGNDLVLHGNPAAYASLSPPALVIPVTVSTVAKRSSRKRNRDEDGDNNKRRSRPINWIKDRGTLYHLYITASMTAQEVADTMKLYGIQVEASTLRKKFIQWPGFKKNKSTFQHNLNRTRVAPSVSKAKALRSAMLTRTVRQPGQGISLTPSQSAEPLFPQASIFHAIERLVLGSFNQKRPAGAPSPLLEAERESETWESVYSRCLGLAGMCRQNTIGGKFYFLWNEFIKELNAAVRMSTNSLAFLVHFWRIAACLWEELSCRVRVNSPSCFTFFFWIFLRNVKAHFQGKRPELPTIIDNLFNILKSSPRDVKNTLGQGCIKTMGVIGRGTGLAHPFMLKLSGAQYQYWKNEYVHDEQLLAQYKRFLHTVDFIRPTPDEIVILTDYTLLQRHSKPETAPAMASILYNLTLEPCQAAAQQGGLTYSPAARALAFSAELLAVSQLNPVLVTGKLKNPERQRQRAQSFRDLSHVIDLLGRGDLDCRVRAAELSRRLTIWYKTFISPKEAKISGVCLYREQKKVTTKIMSQIGQVRISVPEGQQLVPKRPHRRPPQEDANSRNNRLRRKMAEKGRIVVSMIKGSANDTLPSIDLTGGAKSPRRGKKIKEKGPAQTPPLNWPQGRTCRNCGESFPSGNQLFRHHPKCAKRNSLGQTGEVSTTQAGSGVMREGGSR